MYTAKKVEVAQNPDTRAWYIITEFSNGNDTFVEKIYPQDKVGYEYWLQGKLQSLNGLTELITANDLNQVITVATPVAPTAAEPAKQLWMERDSLKEQVDKAIAKGYLTGTEPKVVQLNNWLKENFKPEYINLV